MLRHEIDRDSQSVTISGQNQTVDFNLGGATPTPTPTQGVSCIGDCDGSGDVTVNELITMVNIALGNALLSACPAGDPDGSGDITVNEIIQAVGFALTSCPAT
jgi:hypothetical protein